MATEKEYRFISFPHLGGMSPIIDIAEILTVEPYKKRVDYQIYTYHLAVTMKNGKEVYIKYESQEEIRCCDALTVLKHIT